MAYKERPIEKKYFRLKEVVIDSGLSTGQVKLRCQKLGIDYLKIPIEKYGQIVSMEIIRKEALTHQFTLMLTKRQIRKLNDYSEKHGITPQEALRKKAFKEKIN